MAEIASYRCSNALCRMSMLLSRKFPIWGAETPREMKTLSITPAHAPYIVGFHSDIFCHHCKKVVAYMGSVLCPFCKSEDLEVEQSGKACPRCSAGTFALVSLSVY